MPAAPRRAAPKPLLQSWSYSVYSVYNECPQRIYFSHVQKLRVAERQGPPLIKGEMVHRAAETYVGTVEPRPKLVAPVTEATVKLAALGLTKTEMAEQKQSLNVAVKNLEKMKPDLDALRKMKARPEVKWAFDREYAPVPYFDRAAWLRIQADVYAEVYRPRPLLPIVDYKTGQAYPDHRQQRSLYAMGALHLASIGALMSRAKFADLTVTASHWYIDLGHKDTETFGAASLKPLMREWAARTKEMLADTVYAPRPSSRACRFCPYKKSLGGPCQEAM